MYGNSHQSPAIALQGQTFSTSHCWTIRDLSHHGQKVSETILTQAPSFTRTCIHYPKLGNFIPLLTERLNHEIQLPERQRHTTRRHFEWLQDQGFEGQYCSVSAFIRKFNQQHQPSLPPAFIKQRFAPTEVYQFDWSIETVQIVGLAIKVNVAHFRLCHSRACFVVAYPNQKMDMLIDALLDHYIIRWRQWREELLGNLANRQALIMKTARLNNGFHVNHSQDSSAKAESLAIIRVVHF